MKTSMANSKVLSLTAKLYASVALAMGLSSAAFAAKSDMPATADQQMYRSTLAPTSRLNNMPRSIILTETVNPLAGNATEFLLQVNDRSYQFKVLEATVDACHSIRYVAHNQDDYGNVMDLELIDNQTRTCADVVGHPATWIAHLQVPTPDRPTTVDFVGVPMPVQDLGTVRPNLDVKTDLNPL